MLSFPEGMASRLRLRHLHCFVAVAHQQHLGRAAEQLRLTQPAISKTLAELEDLAGQRLFERGRQGARLTAAGSALLPHAVRVIEDLQTAGRVLAREAAPARQSVHVGALPTVAPDLLPEAIGRLRQRRPDLRITIDTGANAPLLAMLKAGAMDFVVGRMADPEQMMGLAFEFLYVEPLTLAVRRAHPLARRPNLGLAEVFDYPLLLFSRGTIPRHNAESFLQAQGMRVPHNCIETLSVSVGRRLALGSDAVWFAPLGAIRADLAQRTLVQLPLDMQGTIEPVGLLNRSEDGMSDAAREFAAVLRETARLLRSDETQAG